MSSIETVEDARGLIVAEMVAIDETVAQKRHELYLLTIVPASADSDEREEWGCDKGRLAGEIAALKQIRERLERISDTLKKLPPAGMTE